MNSVENAIEFWSTVNTEEPPFIQPDDWNWVTARPKYREQVRLIAPTDPKDWVKAARENRIEAGLLPSPYAGDLRNADIVICLLNPGLGFADFYAEQASSRFRLDAIDTLSQSNRNNAEFPFFALDPQHCWTGAYGWWIKKLGDVIDEIARAQDVDFVEASRLLSKRFAAIELFPYHSRTFSYGSALDSMPSCLIAKQLLSDLAKDKNRTIIVTRQARIWGAEESSNVIVYGAEHARSASLSVGSRGGKAMLQQILGVN